MNQIKAMSNTNNNNQRTRNKLKKNMKAPIKFKKKKLDK